MSLKNIHKYKNISRFIDQQGYKTGNKIKLLQITSKEEADKIEIAAENDYGWSCAGIDPAMLAFFGTTVTIDEVQVHDVNGDCCPNWFTIKEDYGAWYWNVAWIDFSKSGNTNEVDILEIKWQTNEENN